jgi:hypothetical protein
MKLTKSKLKQMIKEELGGEYEDDPVTDLEDIIKGLEDTVTKPWEKQRPQPDVSDLINSLRDVLDRIKSLEGPSSWRVPEE